MSKKDKLLEKLLQKPRPKDFKKSQLDTLMKRCGCAKLQGGRGSGIRYYHPETGRILQFDEPHPGDELYGYHIKETINFLKEIGIIDEQ